MTAADVFTVALLAVVLFVFVRWCCCTETSPAITDAGSQGAAGEGPRNLAGRRPGSSR